MPHRRSLGRADAYRVVFAGGDILSGAPPGRPAALALQPNRHHRQQRRWQHQPRRWRQRERFRGRRRDVERHGQLVRRPNEVDHHTSHRSHRPRGQASDRAVACSRRLSFHFRLRRPESSRRSLARTSLEIAGRFFISHHYAPAGRTPRFFLQFPKKNRTGFRSGCVVNASKWDAISGFVRFDLKLWVMPAVCPVGSACGGVPVCAA